jgi:NitT/TauT family transport system permease protein
MTAAKRRSRALALAPWFVTIGFFVIWEAFCRMAQVSSFVLPAPSTIFAALYEHRGQLLYHAYHTLLVTLAGFLLAVAFGFLVGVALGASQLVNAGTYPLLVGFNTVPKVAVVPIFVFWFGIGWLPPVMIAFLASFFPVAVNVATGISTIEPEVEDVLRALGASRADVIAKVGIPRAMPYFFGSLKITMTLSYVGAVLGEQLASSVGIGHLIGRAAAAYQVSLVWAALVVLGVMGAAMYGATALVERSTTGWAQRSQMAA